MNFPRLREWFDERYNLQALRDLARHKGGKAKFVEKKYFAILDKPVVATGEMTYTAPDRLEKRTLTPKVETMILDKDILSIERDKQKLSINLANQPEAPKASSASSATLPRCASAQSRIGV